METNTTRDQDRETWAVMNMAAHAMRRARDRELRQAGITMTQAAVLWIVKGVKEPVTPAMLSLWLFREPHTVSAILGRMEKLGLINKVKDLPRKNIVRVTLTEKGEEAYEKSSEAKVLRNIMSCLSPEERDTLRGCAERMWGKAIEELREEPRWRFP